MSNKVRSVVRALFWTYVVILVLSLGGLYDYSPLFALFCASPLIILGSGIFVQEVKKIL